MVAQDGDSADGVHPAALRGLCVPGAAARRAGQSDSASGVGECEVGAVPELHLLEHQLLGLRLHPRGG
eukprot:2123024-Pyramimonas_sp.AAC.1